VEQEAAWERERAERIRKQAEREHMETDSDIDIDDGPDNSQ